MRILTVAVVLATSVAGAQTKPAPKRAGAAVSAPELPGPRLKLLDSAKVSSGNDRFEAPAAVFVGPGGKVLLSGSEFGGSIKSFDSTGRRLWTLDTRYEIGWTQAAGWLGSKIWIADPGRSQIAIVEMGEFTKSIELPTWIRPKFSQRKTFPVFGGMDVHAYLEDGSLVVLPREAHSIVGTSTYDEKMAYVLKVTEDGVIEQTIARFPSLEYARRNSPGAVGGRNRYDAAVSSAHWPLYRVSPDGKRTVVVTVDTASQKHDTVHVRVYDDKGTEVFTKTIPFPTHFYSDAEADSVAKERFFARMSFADRTRATKAMSRRAPSATGAWLGRDQSVWIGFRRTGDTRPILGFDSAGQAIGTLWVPITFQLKAVDGRRMWAANAKDRSQYVMRYSIGKL